MARHARRAEAAAGEPGLDRRAGHECIAAWGEVAARVTIDSAAALLGIVSVTDVSEQLRSRKTSFKFGDDFGERKGSRP